MDVVFESRGRIGIVTLNRLQALNALTLAMVIDIDRQLAAWADDQGIAAVVIRSAGGRAFCAGGDIRALYEASRRGDAYTRDFYRREYRLNHRIKTYPKPYFALIDGIVMGGGVGLSVHGSHRVISERCQFAMPETGIGFFPDVGGTWFLPRLAGRLGTYLGLTGARVGAADTLYCGIATHHCRSDALGSLLDELARDGAPAFAGLGADAGPPPLAPHRPVIDRCFAADSVEEILDRLDREPGEWAKETAAVLRRKSPTSLKIVLRQLRLGAELRDFATAMQLEYRLSQRCVGSHDFHEGVRAAVIDKDQAPRWEPATLAEVDDNTVAGYFAPLDEQDLDLG